MRANKFHWRFAKSKQTSTEVSKPKRKKPKLSTEHREKEKGTRNSGSILLSGILEEEEDCSDSEFRPPSHHDTATDNTTMNKQCQDNSLPNNIRNNESDGKSDESSDSDSDSDEGSNIDLMDSAYHFTDSTTVVEGSQSGKNENTIDD